MLFALSASNAVHADAVNGTVSVGGAPWGVAYDSAKGEIFVANSGGNTVSIITDSTNTVVATVTVGSNPYDLGYDSARGEIFVANSFSRSVSVISDSSNQVVATVSVGSGPLGVAYDSVRGEIFVANSVTGTVSVISDSSNTVVATVTVGSSPGPVVYDSGTGEVFVVNRNSGMVSVISNSTNSVVATLAVGNKPYGAAYDSNRGTIIVSNYGDSTLSVVSDSSNKSPPSSPSTNDSSLLQQVWVPNTTNTVVAVGVTSVVTGAVSLIFASIGDPLSGLGGTLEDKTKGIIPDNIKQWLDEVVSSRNEVEVEEKIGSIFAPTKIEMLAYVTSIVVLMFSFSYVKVVTLDQIWQLLPVFLITGVLV